MDWADYQKMKSDVETVIKPTVQKTQQMIQILLTLDKDETQSKIDEIKVELQA